MSKTVHSTLLVCFVFCWLFLSVILPTSVKALDGANFIFDPGNPESTNDVRSANNNFDDNGDDYGEDGWGLFKVYSKDFLGLGPKLLAYNSSASSVYNSGKGGGGQRQPVFTLTYFCSAADGKIAKEKPSDGTFYEITYAVVLEDSNGKEAEQFMKRDTYNAYGGILTVKKTDTSNADKETRNLAKTKNPTTGIKYPAAYIADPQGNNFGISDAKCRPKAEILGKTGMMRNYNKLSDADKEVLAAVKAEGDGGSSGDGKQDACLNARDISISWIICPIINVGYQTTDYVFKNLIQPLLEDVPVSTAPEDKTYQAWKSFRTLGNIVLIGTLIAVVYAQVRSDN